MIEMFPVINWVKYFATVLKTISMKFIDSIIQNLISSEGDEFQLKDERYNHKIFSAALDVQKEKWMYIIEKVTTINDILRAKTILLIHEFETNENKDQLQNPGWILTVSHSNLFERIWHSVFEFCRDVTEEMMVNPGLAESR